MAGDTIALYPEMSTAAKKTLRARRKPVRGKYHVSDGFPHYSTVNKSHMCMCLQECCQGESGCICITCPCRGKGHENVQS